LRSLKAILAAVILAPVVLLAWGFWIEPASLVTRRTQLEIPGWRTNLRIAVLSDLHIGSPHVGLGQLRKIVRRTNSENPDLVVLLGDFVIGGPRGEQGVPQGKFVEPEPIAKELKNMRAPLGTFAVLGNHDWWYNGGRVWRALAGAGIVVLENHAVHIGSSTQGFWLAGLADLWTRRPDISRDTLRSRP
jgi:predicted MPP superfamily phosphohydrolase